MEQTCCKFGPSGSEFSEHLGGLGASLILSEISGTRFSLLEHKPSRIGRYGTAVLSIGAARFTMGVPSSAGYLGVLFICAVMLSAGFGRLGLGLLATALATLVF